MTLLQPVWYQFTLLFNISLYFIFVLRQYICHHTVEVYIFLLLLVFEELTDGAFILLQNVWKYLPNINSLWL